MTVNNLAARIQSALEQFDAERRRNYWKNWHQHPSAEWAISYNNQLYPVKNVMGIIDRSYEQKSTNELKALLNHNGYTVVQLQHRNVAASKQTNTSAPLLQRFGVFPDEKAFCERFVVPLFQEIGYTLKKEYPCHFRTGRKTYYGKIDLMIFEQDTPITLVEAKYNIQSTAPHTEHVEQARSYALHYGLGTFLITSPEGLWLYKLHRNKESLLRHYKPNDVALIKEELPQLIHDYK